ncbi:hypothetical protein BGZ94_007406 [Podila epigama]|nr:hypothetical protein BGZ94_007406 [Podila epigama]
METRQKQRQGPEPTQRRIRHIQCIVARNLTFTQNANQRTIASALAQPSAQHGNSSNTLTYPHQPTRSVTPSIELPSGASSPTKSYFRSPWRSYQQGIQKIRGPGSETGSTSASESGRTSMIREPIARLSAGIKASVFSVASDAGYASESGSISGGQGTNDLSKVRSRPRTSNDFTHHSHAKDRLDRAYGDERSGSWNQRESLLNGHPNYPASVPNTPPSVPTRDRYLSPHTNSQANTRDSPDMTRITKGIGQGMSISCKESTTGACIDESRIPQFIKAGAAASKPILLDSYFTLHEPINDKVIYTSETVAGSNNPKYSPIEEHRFVEEAARRSSSVTVKIWAGLKSEKSLLLEWRVQLCCLRFIGKDLRDVPAGLPNNTILFGLENGFYTAPDDEDMVDHAHPYISEHESIPPHIPASRSYTYESVMRLNNLHECIADTKKSRDEIKYNIEVALSKENAPMIMVSMSVKNVEGSVQSDYGIYSDKWGMSLMFLKQVYAQEFSSETLFLAATLRKEHAARRQALIESVELGQTQDMYLEENMANLANNKESLFMTLKEYSAKRTELIATLFTIFPITEACCDEDMVAIALGHVCHFVTMLAHYLNVPLRYPLTPMGSRAFVLDPVSLLVGPKDNAHYFACSPFQLMNSQGLQFMDLRQTLPNMRYLMETLLTSSPVKKQDRLEQERLNDLFIISLEQRDGDHTLQPALDNEGNLDDSGRRRHERHLSAGSSSLGTPAESRRVTNISSERMPLLVREYDPIDGEYTLVLTDPASPRSNASRKSSSIKHSKLNDDGSLDAFKTPRASPSRTLDQSDKSQAVDIWPDTESCTAEEDADMTAVGEKFDSTRESSTGSSGTRESGGTTSTLTKILLDPPSGHGSTTTLDKIQTHRRVSSTADDQAGPETESGTQSPTLSPSAGLAPAAQIASSPLYMMEKNTSRNHSRRGSSNSDSLSQGVPEVPFETIDMDAGSDLADTPPLPPRPLPTIAVTSSRSSRFGARLSRVAASASSATKEAILRRQSASPPSNALEASG